jgi:ATP synthase protein I
VRWALAVQSLLTIAAASVALALSGLPSAGSAALGGGVAVAGSLAYAVVAGRPVDGSPVSALRGLVRAEACKVLVVVMSLWAVFSLHLVSSAAVFFAVFVLAVIAFSVAALVRDR